MVVANIHTKKIHTFFIICFGVVNVGKYLGFSIAKFSKQQNLIIGCDFKHKKKVLRFNYVE